MTEPTNPNHDPSGNAPLIPRSELIDILNTVQLLQTRIVILLNKYAPDHFIKAEARPDKTTPTIWVESSSGTGSEQVVSTTT